jgi:hypothetical protein
MKLNFRGYLFFFFSLFLSFTYNSKANYTFKSNGKSYEIVETKYSWADAAKYASDNGGYLVHIDSQAEQDSIYNAIINGAKINSTYTVIYDGGGVAYIWIGATDKKTEGTWNWDGNNDGTGINFWNGQGSGGNGDGSAVSGKFYNWGGKYQYSSPKEPDNYGGSQNAAAIALEAWPKNNGSYGKASEWNDISETNLLYFIVEYDYTGKPGKPIKPTGTENLCQNAADTEYKTNEVLEADSYIWYLSPISAGSINNGTSSTITVDWNKDFYGTAELSVTAKNSLGIGDTSEKLIVTINPTPAKPAKPAGITSVLKNSGNTEYTVSTTEFANSYLWKLIPASDGKISGTSNKANVEWAKDSTGLVEISVKAINTCGESQFSEILQVRVSDTAQTSIDYSNNKDNLVKIYPNPATDYIEINLDIIAAVNPTLKRGVDEGSEIQIFDMLGVIQSTTVCLTDTSASGGQRIDVSFLSPGMYIIKIGNRFEKFVKM